MPAARRHIAAHYDLGNELFALFLDETMTYSCGFFENGDTSLREAQEAKLDLVCRKLELRPDDHLVEIGSGWGSLALHAAGNYGCRVTTATLSPAQLELAKARARDAGLDDRVDVVLRDYRDLRGRHSKLASIEMIEAVGWQYFDTFFACCSRLLEPDGLMLLQAITIDDAAYEFEKGARSFANELIFPGGCLPSQEVIRQATDHVTDMRILDVDDITASYPQTLRHWRELRGTGVQVLHLVTPGVDTDMLDDTRRVYGRHMDADSWSDMSPQEWAAKVVRAVEHGDHVLGPGGRLALAKLASRGPAALLDAVSRSLFTREPR